MSIFIMEPVLSSSFRISDKSLWQAEGLLQNLANRISQIPTSNSKGIEKQRNKLLEILRQDKAEQRSQSDWKIKQTVKAISELNLQHQKLNEAMEAEISLLLGKEDPNMMSIGKVLTWKQREDSRLDGIYLDTEHQLAQFSSELDNFTVQLNHMQSEIRTSSNELSNLIREDKRLNSADRTKDIQTEINELSVRTLAVRKEAAKICQIPYSKTLKVDSLIARHEKDLKEINAGLIQAGESLNNTDLAFNIKRSHGAAGKRKNSELETVVDQVKSMVEGKKDSLRQLYDLRQELVRLSRLEKTARLDLNGELARLEKQKSRTSVINEIKSKQEYRNQNLNLIREKINEVEENIETIKKKLFSIRQRRRFNDQKIENIQHFKSSIDNCLSMLNAEKSKHGKITPSVKIWYNSIQFRIKKVRSRISFGSVFRLLFLPFQCHNRYQLGLKIRKDLILVERSFQQLGLLEEDYIKRVDIFNRKTKKGQQMCLDILFC